MDESKFNIVLIKSSANKVAMMQAVRAVNPKEFTALKRAKDFIDNPPGIVLANVSQSVADKGKTILEKAGAVVEMKPV